MSVYGEEVIIDMHDCDQKKFTRNNIQGFLDNLCQRLNLKQCELYWWDDVDVPEKDKQVEPHLKGTTVVQFIMTSSIVIHTLDILGKVFINVFACGEVDIDLVESLSLIWFDGKIINSIKVNRE